MAKKKVAVIGLGYVGLPTLVAIAESDKYQAVGYDVDKNKLALIEARTSPIQDEVVEEFLKKSSLNVSFNTDILENTDIFVVCVPTPVSEEYEPDYSFVISAAETAGKYLKKGAHCVIESTVNPGACREHVLPVLEKESELKAGSDFNLAHCPERINPGDPKWTIFNISRNVGSISPEMNGEVADFYRHILPEAKVNEVSSLEIAEATKIVENTFRDINIAYVNELAKSFDAMGIDLHETLTAASTKPFAFMPHWPGAGVGGHCIAVDPYYLIQKAAEAGFEHTFLKTAREINNSMPAYAVDRLKQGLKEAGIAEDKAAVVLLGLSYKPNISDTRESPAVDIQQILDDSSMNAVSYDPMVRDEDKTLQEVLEGADAVILGTAHEEFKGIEEELIKAGVRVIVDGRNAWDKEKLSNTKIIYLGIGR